jgi:hypothetical protein
MEKLSLIEVIILIVVVVGLYLLSRTIKSRFGTETRKFLTSIGYCLLFSWFGIRYALPREVGRAELLATCCFYGILAYLIFQAWSAYKQMSGKSTR